MCCCVCGLLFLTLFALIMLLILNGIIRLK
ncbi:conserved Plasmodium protein, unknown function [Plasmodium vinckei vinckei]|uniref:Uncharacterized protein n=1 Tax=Plasmodium vinckei vinckei TaxID=54757 RepID=A0A449BSQ4_PLAVN|nr:conserved Plasmodium protein, unknown function [Plasmodium vinckei vinckei]VEV56506.1 conserved Plasmodium protein, unknown function [Plasmodium vinckei vinckei]